MINKDKGVEGILTNLFFNRTGPEFVLKDDPEAWLYKFDGHSHPPLMYNQYVEGFAEVTDSVKHYAEIIELSVFDKREGNLLFDYVKRDAEGNLSD